MFRQLWGACPIIVLDLAYPLEFFNTEHPFIPSFAPLRLYFVRHSSLCSGFTILDPLKFLIWFIDLQCCSGAQWTSTTPSWVGQRRLSWENELPDRCVTFTICLTYFLNRSSPENHSACCLLSPSAFSNCSLGAPICPPDSVVLRL